MESLDARALLDDGFGDLGMQFEDPMIQFGEEGILDNLGNLNRLEELMGTPAGTAQDQLDIPCPGVNDKVDNI